LKSKTHIYKLFIFSKVTKTKHCQNIAECFKLYISFFEKIFENVHVKHDAHERSHPL